MGNAGKEKDVRFFIEAELSCHFRQRTWGVVQQRTEIALLMRLQM